jgi:hypothetical protein
MSVETRSWQELCEAITNETDSEQLMRLTAKLLRALDDRKVSVRPTEPEEPASFFEHSRVPAISVPMSAEEGSATVEPNSLFLSQTL